MQRHRFLTMCFVCVTLLTLSMGSVPAQGDPIQEIIREKVEQIRLSGNLTIGEAEIASVTVVPELYERRKFRPAWTNPNAIDDLVRAVDDIDKDGLDSGDYNLVEIERFRAKIQASDSPDPEDVASFDILLTDSLTRLGYHLIFGKVDPEELYAHWNLAREVDDVDPVDAIQNAIDSGSLAEVIDQEKPQHAIYKGLKLSLARYVYHIDKQLRSFKKFESCEIGTLLA